MSSSGVEAFLAAKWEHKKMEMENDIQEKEEPHDRELIGSPTKFTNVHENTTLQGINSLSAAQEGEKRITIIPSKQGTSFTQKMIVKQLNVDEVPFSAPKTVGILKTDDDDDFDDQNDNIARGNDPLGYMENLEAGQAHACDEISNELEGGESTIVELPVVYMDKPKQYELMGDVWGLLEQETDQNDREDEDMLGEDVKSLEPAEMMFGALSPKDLEKWSDVANTNAEQTTIGAPKMFIPFGNFGKLLEEPDPGLEGSPLILKKLHEHKNQENTKELNASPPKLGDHTVIHSSEEPQNDAQTVSEGVKLKCQPGSRKAKITSRKRALPRKNSPKINQSLPLNAEEVEPDSTTKLRQTPPKSKANLTQQSQPEMKKTNRDQRLEAPMAETSTAIDSTSNQMCDPQLGPLTGSTPNPDMLPIGKLRSGMDSLTKKVIYNVSTYFKNRRVQHNLKINELCIASDATGINKNLISKTMIEAFESITQENQPIFSGRTSRAKTRRKHTEVNVKRDCIARMFIHNSYLIKKEVPTLKKIMENCQENGFETVLGATTNSVHVHLKKLGFEYSARSGSKKFLIERPDFIAQRIRYLELIQEYRSQGRNIIFVFVGDLLKRGLKEVEWESWDGEFHENERGLDLSCVSVMHAASGAYVFHDSLQVTEYIVNSSVEPPHQIYSQWLMKKVLPRIPKGSVIVLGDRKFHNMVDAEQRPHLGHSKEQITGWLNAHRVQANHTWPKALLLEQVQKVVLDQKYVIDDSIITLGHIPVHLPTHHRDLNPLSYMWQDIKDKLDNAPEISHYQKLRMFVKGEFTKAATKLSRAWTQVEKLEKSYFNIDVHTDNVKEQLILKYGDCLVPINNEYDMICSDDDENSIQPPPNKKARTTPP